VRSRGTGVLRQTYLRVGEQWRRKEGGREGPGHHSSGDGGASLLVDEVVDAAAGVEVLGVVDDLERVEPHPRVGTVGSARVRRELEPRRQGGLEIGLGER
jgi:hypothetical protein